MREQEVAYKKKLNEKDQHINDLKRHQKSIDLDLHNLTEQLFEVSCFFTIKIIQFFSASLQTGQ